MDVGIFVQFLEEYKIITPRGKLTVNMAKKCFEKTKVIAQNTSMPSHFFMGVKHKKRIVFTVFRAVAIPCLAVQIDKDSKSIVEYLSAEGHKPVHVAVTRSSRSDVSSTSDITEKAFSTSFLTTRQSAISNIINGIIATSLFPLPTVEDCCWVIRLGMDVVIGVVGAHRWAEPKYTISPDTTLAQLQGVNKKSIAFEYRQQDLDSVYSQLKNSTLVLNDVQPPCQLLSDGYHWFHHVPVVLS